jgi:hypothetical protein
MTVRRQENRDGMPRPGTAVAIIRTDGPAGRSAWPGIKPVDRVREEEPQRRDDAVHGRRRHAGVTLFDLEAAHVIRRRRIR